MSGDRGRCTNCEEMQTYTIKDISTSRDFDTSRSVMSEIEYSSRPFRDQPVRSSTPITMRKYGHSHCGHFKSLSSSTFGDTDSAISLDYESPIATVSQIEEETSWEYMKKQMELLTGRMNDQENLIKRQKEEIKKLNRNLNKMGEDYKKHIDSCKELYSINSEGLRIMKQLYLQTKLSKEEGKENSQGQNSRQNQLHQHPEPAMNIEDALSNLYKNQLTVSKNLLSSLQSKSN